MFGGQNAGNNSGAPQGPPPRPTVAIPPLHTWEITVYNGEAGGQKITVQGHGMTTLDNGGLVIQRFYVLANLGPTPFPVYGTSSYIEFRDVTPEGGQSTLVEVPMLVPEQEDESRILH